MGDKTKIEWADATWNPLRAQRADGTGKTGWHCEKISPACAHCYAARQNLVGLFGGTKLDYVPSSRELVRTYLDVKTLTQPLRWRRPRRIFPCSMTDIFGEWVRDEQIDQIFAVMALADRHTFQVLTKRPERMLKWLTVNPTGRACDTTHARVALWAQRIAAERGEDTSSPWWDAWLERWPLANVQLGVTAEMQEWWDYRVPILRRCPAAVRFVSCEPMLGPIAPRFEPHPGMATLAEIEAWERERIHGIIVGGESGTGARPMHPQWARDLRDQCADAGTAFFFKQWGDWQNGSAKTHNAAVLINGRYVFPDTLDGREKLDRESGFQWNVLVPVSMARVGKKKAGRLLDGREHNDLPARPAEVAS